MNVIIDDGSSNDLHSFILSLEKSSVGNYRVKNLSLSFGIVVIRLWFLDCVY